MKQLFFLITFWLALADATCVLAQAPPGVVNTGTQTDSASLLAVASKNSAAFAEARAADEVLIYPNPAVNDINVVYNHAADIKNIAVYNIIGRELTVYKVSGTSANLKLEGIPSGVYFVRLFNSRGEAVMTKKFTKQ